MASLITVAQIVGITGAAFASGMIASISLCAIPGLALGPPEIVAKQWRHIYHIGARTMPPVAIACATCFGYLAYVLRNNLPTAGTRLPAQWVMYSAAAVIIPLIAPYTLVVMEPGVNQMLKELAAAADEGVLNVDEKDGNVLVVNRQTMDEILRKWNFHNYVRAAIVGIGALLGAVAIFAM